MPSSPESSASAIQNDAPTLAELIKLTRHELIAKQVDDTILGCGRAALSLLGTSPDLCAKLAYQKLHDVPYKEVKACWRMLYTDATLRIVLNTAEHHINRMLADGNWVDEIVKLLDMTLILAGAPGREGLLELWFAAVEEELAQGSTNEAPESSDRPRKKLKLENATVIPTTFPTAIVRHLPNLRRPISRVDDLSLAAFQKKVSYPATQTPLVIQNAIQHWPALLERPWSDPNYLLKRTLGGRRLVPIETGRSYTDAGWGQKISTFRDFVSTYMLNEHHTTNESENERQKGYLAQHDLFAQIPSLRADISIPDFCYCDPAPNPLSNIKATSKLEDPLLNAWFGPKGTISPLHTDPYHNILAQVVGYKYVRLYAPDQTKSLYPRSVDESGVDMSNTSQVDLDEAMRLYPQIGISAAETGANGIDAGLGNEVTALERAEFEKQFPDFAGAKYVEAVLGPGECLYIPPGWWHYVKSLSPSFSVSFWFN
jgi:lysine-specific demethylase 8